MILTWSPPGPADPDLPLDGPGALDACLPWDRLTGQARHPVGEAWPVIVELALPDGLSAAAAVADWLQALPPPARDNWARAFAASLALAPASAHHTALLPEGCESTLLQAVQAGRLWRFQLGARCRARATWVPTLHAGRLGAGPAPQVLGVIDDGCCFAHEDYRRAAGCRVRALWDQNPAAGPGDGWQAPAEGGLGYGVEMLQAELDQALQAHPTRGEAGERALYRSIGRPEWGNPTRTHGARVMHLLAGPGPGGGGAGEMPLIFVQLPKQTVGDTSGDSLGLHVLDGARYIVARARQIDKTARVTINISLGSVAGPHDGSSLAEEALAELAAQPGVTLVMAAGNTAGDDARLHARQTVAPGTSGRFVARVPPALRRDSFVELWIEPEAADRLMLHAVAPNGLRSKAVRVGQLTALRDGQGRVLAALAFVRNPAQGRHGALALLSLAPTEAAGGDRAPAPVGFWSVELSCTAGPPSTVHAWVERDDEVIGSRRPQQLRFENPTGAADDTSVDDDMTLSNLANANGLVVVGGYVQSPKRVAAYSANGPRRTDPGGGPTHYAPSDRSDWLRGVAVPGFFSGTHSAIGGTSAAAPQVARALAESRALRRVPQPGQVGAAAPETRPPRPARAGRELRPGTRWLP